MSHNQEKDILVKSLCMKLTLKKIMGRLYTTLA